MITIFKSTDQGLKAIKTLADGSWVNVVDPSIEEIAQLREWGIPTDFVTHSLDINERSRMERNKDLSLLILRLPYAQGEMTDIPYITIPLGIILTDKLIVTICRKETSVIQEFTDGRIHDLSTDKKNQFVLQLLLHTIDQYLYYLRHIDDVISVLEYKLYRSQQNKEVMDLLKYQKSLVYFTTALRSKEPMLEHLQKIKFFHANPDEEELLENVLIEIRQAIEVTSISENILSQMMGAFASIVSNNLNVVMKFLAAMTIVMSVPTLIAALYGMNIRLPGQAHHSAFPLILLLSLMISLFVVIIFLKKEWL